MPCFLQEPCFPTCRYATLRHPSRLSAAVYKLTSNCSKRQAKGTEHWSRNARPENLAFEMHFRIFRHDPDCSARNWTMHRPLSATLDSHGAEMKHQHFSAATLATPSCPLSVEQASGIIPSQVGAPNEKRSRPRKGIIDPCIGTGSAEL